MSATLVEPSARPSHQRASHCHREVTSVFVLQHTKLMQGLTELEYVDEA
jgi:hypothetical protein